MSVFTQKLNPLIGKIEWEVQNEDYDYHQEIACSGFADMLHDTERNQKYYLALQTAINAMHAQNRKANVLDIGTGTGLLSMMAVKCGADTVTACETFVPVADCASKIIETNQFSDRIKLIKKNSLDLIIGDDNEADMKERANILVTEVFDTELIGEGAIKVFKHAHKELLERDCIVVPHSATIYAQVVESPLALSLRTIKSIVDSDDGHPIIEIPNTIEKCAGSPAIHDIQLNQFPITHFQTILAPKPVFHFDWSGRTELMKCRNTLDVGKAEQSGRAQVVFMWWDLKMDSDEKIVLSCAPYWAHPDIEDYMKNSSFPMKDSLPWRDHWMQGVYYLQKELTVTKGQELTLISNHDKYSLWFNLKDRNCEINIADYKKLSCECGLHSIISRTRIGQINDSTRNKKYLTVLKEKINPNTICLCLSDGTLLGLLAAKLGAKRVYCITNLNLIRDALNEFAISNEIVDKITFFNNMNELVENGARLKNVNLVIGEPFFNASLLPWHNLYFMRAIRNELLNCLPGDVDVMPKKAVLYGMAVHFYHLHKIKSNLNRVEGFDMRIFDNLIQNSINKSIAPVEPQPLWEYTGTPLSLPVKIMEFELSSFNSFSTKKNVESIQFEGDGVLNGVAFWIDWHLDDSSKNIITTGPILSPQFNEEIKWDMHTRQGVYLFSDSVNIEQDDLLEYTVHFDTEHIDFELKLNGKQI